MHYAAVKGKLQFLRELINHGSDVNIEDNVSILDYTVCKMILHFIIPNLWFKLMNKYD